MKLHYDPSEICYLCGNQLGTEEVNEDHIFQQQFVSRKHPKTQGYDYAGVLLAHKACNAKFGGAGQGPESICRKALHLLEVLHSDAALWRQRKDNPNIRILGLTPASLPEFTDQDARFFGLIDARNISYNQMISPEYLADKPRVNVFRTPTNIALSTLAKSTAGFLVKRYDFPRQGRWRILAMPYIANNPGFDLDGLFGNVKPLELKIKLWIKREGGGWFAAYKHNRLLVYFCFESVATNYLEQVKATFHSDGWLFFDSDQLITLVGYDWCKNMYPL